MTAMSTASLNPESIVQEAEAVAGKLAEARAAIAEVIFGQETVVDLALATVLVRRARAAGRRAGPRQDQARRHDGDRAGPDRNRIQFTPDLMPADILGSEVLDESADRRGASASSGAGVRQLLMADEINRASPRTQSALLQAMQEHFVTVAGQRHDLPQPFHVLATQNPIEQEGTYPLPEAQLDRFLMQIDVLYPDLDAERRMLFETTGDERARRRARC